MIARFSPSFFSMSTMVLSESIGRFYRGRMPKSAPMRGLTYSLPACYASAL